MKHNNFCQLPTVNCNLPVANCPLLIANWILPIVLCLLLIAYCLLPTASFAQNTFRYSTSQETGRLTYWASSGVGFTQQLASDSGYVSYSGAGRYTKALYLPNPPDDSLAWNCFSLIKLDKYANLSWIKAYQEKSTLRDKIVADGTNTADGGFVMVGERGNINFIGSVTFIQKTDKDGHLLWAKIFPIGGNDNKAIRVKPMPDSGVVVMGQTKDFTYSTNHSSYNTYLLRLDKNGNKLWSEVYDAKENGEEYPYSIDLANDGGYIIGGGTDAEIFYGFKVKTRLIGYKGFMMKVSADGQTVEWARRYGEIFKGTYPVSSDWFKQVKQTSDGGFIAVGRTEPNGQDTKGWVVKTNSLGVIVWQKTYDTWSDIDKIEVLSDGYMLASTESEADNQTGNKDGRLTKISATGEVEWSKLYDGSISDMHLAIDKGFVITQRGFEGVSGNYYKDFAFIPGGNILKTNSLGEFENGCIYNGALSSWIDERIDTAYTLTPTNPNFSISNLALNEVTIQGMRVCPVSCGISTKPIASQLYVGLTCANTDAQIQINPFAESDRANYSHYKLNFGDPISGEKNETTGSTMTNMGYILHNYSNPGTYIITMVVYNGDYSETDTSSTRITVVPKMKLTLLTPEIHVCKKDTISIYARIENYVPGTFFSNWFGENYGNKGILSQSFTTINDNTQISAVKVIADSSLKFVWIKAYAGSSTATDGCVVIDTVNIITGDNKAAITGNTNICKGGTSTLIASGGDSYLWSTGATTGSISVSPLSNKTFWVEATSKDGCRDTAYAYLKVAAEINVNAFTILIEKPFVADQTGCVGDTAMIYATGGQNYSWSNGSSSDTVKVVLANGINTFKVTGTSGSCKATASVSINADPLPNPSISGMPANVCAGQTLNLKASGGERYYWRGAIANNPDYSFVNIYSAGEVSVTVFNGGCSKDTTIPFTTGGAPSARIACEGCRVCPGTLVTLKKSIIPPDAYSPEAQPDNTGNQYLWNTGSINPDSIQVVVSKDTTITLTTTNKSGCSTISKARIQVKPNFYFKKDVTPIASCSNTPTTISLSGEPSSDFNYSWSNGSKNDTIVVSPLQDTMYYVTATANGCSHTDSIWVKAKSNLPKATINGDSIVCKAGQGTYAVKSDVGIQSYKWLTGNAADTHASLTMPVAANTTLKAYVTFAGGCGDTAEYKIGVTDAVHALISGDTLICPGGTTSLHASGGITYKWSTLETNPDIAVTTNIDKGLSLYAFAGNCKDSATITVRTNQIIKATLFSDENTTCLGTPLTLIAGGGDNYVWNTGGSGEMLGISPAATTTYTVTVTTKDNCKDSQSITIQISPAPHAQITSASVCAGDILTLTASGGDKYLWSTGDLNASLTIKNPKTDSIYRVSVFVGSCADSTQAKVNVLPKPIVDAGANISINSGNSTPVFVTGSGTYQWSPSAGLSCTDCASPLAEPSQSTLYYITLKDANGCKNTDSVMVYVDLPCGDVFVPSAFSPNNDGNNDLLFVRGRCIQSMNFMVYDRWGNKVFETANQTKGWDGTYNDKPMNAGMFVYYLTGALTSGELVSSKGTIMLMR